MLLCHVLLQCKYQAILPRLGLVIVPTENSVTVPAVTTPQCSGMQSVSIQVGDNFTNTQSLNVSAEPSSIVYSQNAAGNNVASLSPLPCQVPNTNQKSILLHTQGAATINSSTSSCTMSHGMPAVPN